MAIIAESPDRVERYTVEGTNILDRETWRIARFQNPGVAQIGADWLNGPEATPEDYEWTSAADMTSDEWLSVHPEVIAAAPKWADTVEATDDGSQVAISYDRHFGSLEIGIAAAWENGKVRFPDPAPAYVYFHANEKGITPDDLRQFAAEFTAAADALEAVAK